jgi:hypothetical protein
MKKGLLPARPGPGHKGLHVSHRSGDSARGGLWRQLPGSIPLNDNATPESGNWRKQNGRRSIRALFVYPRSFDSYQMEKASEGQNSAFQTRRSRMLKGTGLLLCVAAPLILAASTSMAAKSNPPPGYIRSARAMHLAGLGSLHLQESDAGTAAIVPSALTATAIRRGATASTIRRGNDLVSAAGVMRGAQQPDSGRMRKAR